MQSLESLQKQLRKIAAGTHGQVPEVRTVFGRQISMLRNASQIFMLPYSESEPLQNYDPTDPNFGQFILMLGVDGLGGDSPLGG
jgi:hypothetical protein